MIDSYHNNKLIEIETSSSNSKQTKNRKNSNSKSSNDQNKNKYLPPIFLGLHICMTYLTAVEKSQLANIITANDGHVYTSLDDEVINKLTHLIVDLDTYNTDNTNNTNSTAGIGENAELVINAVDASGNSSNTSNTGVYDKCSYVKYYNSTIASNRKDKLIKICSKCWIDECMSSHSKCCYLTIRLCFYVCYDVYILYYMYM